MRQNLRLPYFIAAVLFVAAVTVQIALAGLSLFWQSSTWSTHADLGHLAPLFALALLLLALAGRLPLRLRTWSALLFVGVLVQSEVFAVLSEVAPAAASFHPLLATVLLWGGIVVTQRAWALLRRPLAQEQAATATATGRGTACRPGDPDCPATA